MKQLENKYGKLTPICRIAEKGVRSRFWKCLCDCGKETVVLEDKLINGQVQSCKKCSQKERLHHIWQSMKQRCYYPKHIYYSRYGGRGITICEEWKNDYKKFKEWALLNGYKDNLSIDRIDINGNYEPSNCRFVGVFQQANNKCNNKKITYDGQTLSIAEWARKTGINISTFTKRYERFGVCEKLFSPFSLRKYELTRNIVGGNAQ